MRLVLCILPVLLACSADGPAPPQGPTPISVVSYNLAGVPADLAGGLVAELANAAPDVAALQECSECAAFVDQLPPRYRLTSERAGVAMVFDETLWILEDMGFVQLGDNYDGWGERVAHWALLTHRMSGGAVYVYSTHFCVTIRTDDDACTVDRQLEYVDSILAPVAAGKDAGYPAVVAGDLNVFDGFADGPVIAALESGGLIDALAIFDPTLEEHTFVGNDWAPPGRLDYIFATSPAEIEGAALGEVPQEGATSDHLSVHAEIVLNPPTMSPN